MNAGPRVPILCWEAASAAAAACFELAVPLLNPECTEECFASKRNSAVTGMSSADARLNCTNLLPRWSRVGNVMIRVCDTSPADDPHKHSR